jgi:hypothetical protein
MFEQIPLGPEQLGPEQALRASQDDGGRFDGTRVLTGADSCVN